MKSFTKFSLIITTVLTAALLFSLSGCGKDEPGPEDLGEYYELSFTDNAGKAVLSDSVHIVITQYSMPNTLKDSIPFEITDDNSLGDTIKLRMEVNFGSYNKTPSPFKQLSLKGDTLHLFYSYLQISLNKVSDAESVTGPATSPKNAYYSIQKVYISKKNGKQITFRSQKHPN